MERRLLAVGIKPFNQKLNFETKQPNNGHICMAAG